MIKLPSIKLPAVSTEHWVLGLIIVGLPVIALMWFGIKAAVTALILTLIVIGIIRLRYS